MADMKNQALAMVEHLRVLKVLRLKQQDCYRKGTNTAKAEVR